MTEYSFGIEEEYFLVDRRTGGVKTKLSRAFMTAARARLGGQLMAELLQSQIEVATKPLGCPAAAREQLQLFRKVLAEVGREHRIGILAAGTHPLARPQQHRTTRKRRYTKVIDELGMVGLSNAICGLHVHVEVPDPDKRVEIMHRMVPFLPILLALSTSSPFWAGTETGLLGYRNALNDAFPRSGFPEMFRSLAEYEEYVGALVGSGIIADATYIWWALRPSLRHRTLELRLTDSCTCVDHAVAIAGLYRALVRHLVNHPEVNASYSALVRGLTEENRWRAQRYGTDGIYVDTRTMAPKHFSVLLEETISLVREDLHSLGLEEEIPHLADIRAQGTSAHRQLQYFRARRQQGKSRTAAFRSLVRWLCASTEAGRFIEEEQHRNSSRDREAA